ncbi:MAG: cyanophycin synthetase, partial [Patescibacteria group bacterium]
AHTPDALRKVYETLRSQRGTVNSQQLICVLGAAGGGRDRWKRPEFGKIAGEFCDEVILTNEDPYDENPSQILSEIESGITKSQGKMAKKIIDRREAICEVLNSAKSGDIIIITGKGAEPWIVGPAGTKIPWDDREVVREELAKLNN